MLEKSPISQQFAPWHDNENMIWLASTLTLRRNIEKCLFPAKLDQARKKQIFSTLSAAILKFSELEQPLCLLGSELSAIEKNFLFENYLILDGIHEAHEGEGFVIDATGHFIAELNLKDHLMMQITDSKGELEKSWDLLRKKENDLAQAFPFAFSEKFGYLTASPLHVGTGLSLNAYMHLPALILKGKLQEFRDHETTDGVCLTGLQGDPEDLIADIVVVRNRFTIGQTEEQILSGVRHFILKLIVAEKNSRNSIVQTCDKESKDKVSRALGLLKFSYKLEAVEALAALSLVKLGIELGWITGISVKEVNFLLFACRKAHLFYVHGGKVLQDEFTLKRADFLRDKMKNTTML